MIRFEEECEGEEKGKESKWEVPRAGGGGGENNPEGRRSRSRRSVGLSVS